MPIRPVNDRAAYGVLVGVYKNLGTRDPKRQWSVRALEGEHKGLKVAEGDSVVLTGCGSYVRESTRQRMISGSADQAKGHMGHREVHAWLTGYLCDEDPAPAGRRPGEAITAAELDELIADEDDEYWREVESCCGGMNYWCDHYRSYQPAHAADRW